MGRGQDKGMFRAVLVVVAWCMILGATSARAEEARSYRIPAGTLLQALHLFAEQSGISVVFDEGLATGKSSQGLQGKYGSSEGLQRLLQGSGLQAQRNETGFVIERILLLRETPQGMPEVVLPEVTATGLRESAGSMRLNREVIDSLPAGNGDITSILRVLPNVQFDRNQLNNGQQGEIAPADISINGAKFYQNLYQLDGMSFNNDLDPASGDKSSSISEVTSAAQGMAIDSSLLCSLTVRDSNVPVAYGGFMGGVVSADTCAPKTRFSGQMSIGTTRSSWMKQKIAPEQKELYENTTSPNYAREFEKWTYKVSLQGKVTDDFGIIGSFIRRTSTIPLNGESAYHNGLQGSPEEKRLTDNFYLKSFWKVNADHNVDASVMYSPTRDERFISAIKDSRYDYTAGGLGFNAGLASRFDKVTFSQRATWNQMESSRQADSSTFKSWRFSADDKNWGTTTLSNEGGYGDIDQQQTTLTYQLIADWEPLSLGEMTHRLQTGYEYADRESYYHRKTPYEYYYGPARWRSSCTRRDGSTDPFCSTAATSNGWEGQYLQNRVVYLPGKFTVKDTNHAAFIQDEIQVGRFMTRLGLRYETSELAAKSTVAPRAAFFFDVFGDGQTRLEAGLNRYYGRNFMAYYMQANRLSLQSATSGSGFKRTGLTDWGELTMSTTAEGYHFDNLRLPYDDEQMLALKQQWGNMELVFKYVDRQSRDQVVQVLRSPGDRRFENAGSGEAQTYSFTAQTLK
ncbi:MAG: hypothetical protein ACRDD3_09005, partial [Azovibrio sp.]